MDLRNSKSFLNIFGTSIMSETKLPTTLDIARHYLFLLSIMHKTKSESIELTVNKISEIWYSASIPTIQQRSIHKRLVRYLIQLLALRKNFGKSCFENSFNKHVEKYNVLYDISSCKCRNFNLCDCIESTKIPFDDRIFIEDQRSTRKMIITASRTSTTK